MKICIFGAGAVGGVMAGWLLKAGHDVTVVARGANLTAIREPERMVTHHLLDALAMLPHLPARTGLRVLDVGSGGGVPGIPLALARPDWRVEMVDTSHKKVAFLTQAAIELGLPNVAAPNDAIYGFWDHLQLDGSSAVLANTFGTAPNRRFVIEYRNVAIYDDPSLRFSFQVVLYEDPNQRIRLQYRGNTAGTLSAGTSATVGHENAAGTSAQQVSFNKGLLYDGLSVRPK